MDALGGSPSPTLGRKDGDEPPPPQGRGEACEARTGTPNPVAEGCSGLKSSPSPVRVPVTSPPPPLIRVTSPPCLSVELPPADASFDGKCTQLKERAATRSDYDQLTYNELHQVCRRRGNARKDSRAVLKTRLSTTGAVERKRAHDNENVMDTSGDKPAAKAKRCRVEDIYPATVVEKDILKERAQWRNSEMTAHQDAAEASLLKGVDAAISAWAADQWKEHWVKNRPLMKKRRALRRWKRLKIANRGRGADSRSTKR